MARVTVDEVKVILDNTELTDPQVQSFIDGANALINEAFSSTTLGAAILKEIERYTSAHLISVTRERMALKEGAGGAFITYTGTYGAGFDSTGYGQTAIAFDTTGTLAALGGKGVKTFAVPGYPSNRNN